MEIIKKDGLEQAKLEKFKIIKNGQNPLEFDFKFHLLLNQRLIEALLKIILIIIY